MKGQYIMNIDIDLVEGLKNVILTSYDEATKLDKKMVVNKFQSSFLKDFCFFAKQCITNCLTVFALMLP